MTHGHSNRLIICLIPILAVLYSESAQAQSRPQDPVDSERGLELRIFRPAVDSKGHITVNASPILPHLDISFGLLLDMAQDIHYAVELEDDQYDNSKVDTYIQGVFHFNIGFGNIVVTGVQVPVAIISGTAAVDPDSDRDWSSQYLGDLSVHAKLRFWRADRRPVGVAALVQAQFPTGEDEYLTAEPGYTTLVLQGILDMEPEDWVRLAFNGGLRYPIGGGDVRAWNDDVPGSPVLVSYGPQVTLGAGVSFRIVPDTIDLIAEYIAATILHDRIFTPEYLPMEFVGGMKIFIERNSYLILGGTGGIPTGGFATPLYRVFLGFVYEPSIGDRDGDTIKDDIDQCIDDPEDFDEFEDTDGCPDPDNDRDTILDVDDQCPLVPEDRDEDEDDDGCPDREIGDRDGDGLKDNVDKCPDDPEDLDQFEDENGCPDQDNDQDTIPDIKDQCPNDPEDLDQFEDINGCPDPDNDRDRIPDVKDSCPNDPEVYNGENDEDGCPDQGRVQISDTDITILDKIYFEYDSAVIKPISFPILDAVAATLKGNPQILKVEIQGHADERGSDDYNIKLTSDRAASVMKYLISHGVDRETLRSAGYGKRCPIDPGHNEAAWEKNRRVEFKILETAAGKTGVKVACEAAKDLIPKK